MGGRLKFLDISCICDVLQCARSQSEVQFILVQSPTVTHMLHVHRSPRLPNCAMKRHDVPRNTSTLHKLEELQLLISSFYNDAQTYFHSSVSLPPMIHPFKNTQKNIIWQICNRKHLSIIKDLFGFDNQAVKQLQTALGIPCMFKQFSPHQKLLG